MNRLAPASLILIGLLAYGWSLRGSYCYDDIPAVRDCRALESGAGLKDLFSSRYARAFGELTYRPVVTASYFLDSLVFGKRPFFSRAINLALHLLVGLALWSLWRILFRRRDVAFLAAAIFLCHPIVSEVVLCPGFREDLLALLFCLWSLLILTRHLLRPVWWKPWAAAAVWLLALLAKEPAILAPLLALVVFFRSPLIRRRARLRWMLSGWIKRAALLAIPFGAALLLYVGLYRLLSYPSAARPWPGGDGPILGVLNFCSVFLIYARLWLAPVHLSIGHYFEPSASYGDLRLWAGALALAAFAIFSVWAYAKRKLSGVGGLWVCVSLLPIAQIMPTPELIAERYLYMAHAGMALMFASLTIALGKHVLKTKTVAMALSAGRTPGYLGGICLVALLIALTISRAGDWRDDVTLNIRRYELWDNAQGKVALGALYFGAGDWIKSQEYYLAAVKFDPKMAEAWRGLAAACFKRNLQKDALTAATRAVELNPNDEKNRAMLELINIGKP
ncbi:MAG: glycosyltransferase family 39 protein [Candidatus Sumerlaeota bacterium]|nr:glycosyltransferase family 39 protein [Candidatus Sumerlaeota bacterium]